MDSDHAADSPQQDNTPPGPPNGSAATGPERTDHRASFQEQRVARVYAEALLNAAEKQGRADEAKHEYRQLVEEVLRPRPEIAEFLANPTVGQKVKEEMIRSAFEGRVSPLLYNFLHVLNEHGRLALLTAAFPVYCTLHDQRSGRIPVKVTTAVPMGEDQTNRLREDMRDIFRLEPILETAVDPEILGGLTIRISDWLYDASVRSQIDSIRKQIQSRMSHEIQRRRDRFVTTTAD